MIQYFIALLATCIFSLSAHSASAADTDTTLGGNHAKSLDDFPYWAVISILDQDGGTHNAVVGLSKSGTSAPEFRSLKNDADDMYRAAKKSWGERRALFLKDRSHSSADFRSIDPEPNKPVIKIIGSVQDSRDQAELILAKVHQEILDKNDPGAARRKRVMEEQLLQYFTIGIEATPEWINETRDQHGARWACNSSYLSHVVETPNDVEGKDTWFIKYGALRDKLNNARKAKVICWNTWYGLADAPPARYQPNPPTATAINAKVQSTMIVYWSLVKKHMQMAQEFNDVDCVLQVEPDEWGHLLISCGWDCNKEGVILVGGSGMPELAGIPDTIKGYAKAFRVLRDRYAPHVLLAANPSAWDRNGSMTGEIWGRCFNEMDVNAKHGWDLFITQVHDWDIGQVSNGDRAKYPPYKESDILDYFGSIDNWCAWIKPIHDATGMWGVAWQLPQGNATYATCDGSDGHGMDGLTELLLDNHPANGVAARMAASGCCMWIFSLGGGGSHVFDAKEDGISNPPAHAGNKGKISIYPDDDGGYLRLKGGEYFQQPTPILAKPVANARSKSKKKSSSSTSREDANDPEETRDSQRPTRTVPTLIDSKLREPWIEQLRQAAVSDVSAGLQPHFHIHSLAAEATLCAMSDDGTMSLDISGSGDMAVSWLILEDRDRAGLAVALATGNDSKRHALAAFFLLLTGDTLTGRKHLALAHDQAAAVEAAFGLSEDQK